MSAPPLIDDAVLGDMVAHLGREAMQPVVELFLGESRDLAAEIAAGDREAARRAAHSLKSSAGQLGAAALAAMAAEIERAAASGASLPGTAGLERCLAETAAALTARLYSD